MNSRRFMPIMAASSPRSVHRTLSLPQSGQRVLWAGLKRSESSEGCCGTRHSSARFTPQKSASPRVYVLPQYPKTAPHDGRTGEGLQSFFQTEPWRLCASVYRHAARLDRPGPFVDLGGDEFGKVFRASALHRCNILTNRFEAFTDERQIKGGA